MYLNYIKYIVLYRELNFCLETSLYMQFIEYKAVVVPTLFLTQEM